ncbi:MAG: phosphodiester glycosidase family protein [Oscillospiraceae bacterium]|nr:phosphodiester glycosidase family protein [Oscillospiraceae bacterium]
MISQEIREFRYESGDLQKVQVVRFGSFSEMDFLTPDFDPESFDRLADLYEDYIIKKYAFAFGNLVLFRLPEGYQVRPVRGDPEYGDIYDPLISASITMERALRFKSGEPVFSDPEAGELFRYLRETGCLRTVRGMWNTVRILPVSDRFGFLSRNRADARLKVNSSFFIMDGFDCASRYDSIGTPFGLCVKDGKILSPPMFGRQVFHVSKSGETEITGADLTDLTVHIGDMSFRHGENCRIFQRPAAGRTPAGGYDTVICGNRVTAAKTGGKTCIPAAGFVIRTDAPIRDAEGITVTYSGMPDTAFAVQVGNSTVVGGKKTDSFISPFYSFMRPFTPSYPPTFYPLSYKKARAPRIVLGADGEGEPMLLWFEGAGKFGYRPGTDSCGASLSEAADICCQLGMRDGIHLDGGGSAQILLNGKRTLMVSDRDAENFNEAERAVPNGLFIM